MRSARDYGHPQYDHPRRDVRYYDANERNRGYDYPRRPQSDGRGYAGDPILNDFRGRIAEEVKHNCGRDVLLKNFTGKNYHHWIIQELIACMDSICQYKVGIDFLAKMNDKMEYKSHAWCDALFKNFERIVNEESGCRLLSSVVSYAPDNYLAPFVRVVFAKIQNLTENDENLINLACSILQVIGDAPTEYQLFLSLAIYLDRPYIAPIAASVLEYGEERALAPFENEIVANVPSLIQSEKLIVLVSACLVRGPRDIRNRIIPQLAANYGNLVKQYWSCQLILDVLSVGVMTQKEFCARRMFELVRKAEIPTYMDKILVHALRSVSFDIRSTMINDARMIAGYGCFPELAKFIAQ